MRPLAAPRWPTHAEHLPFHIRIPQVMWSDMLCGGHGGYYVAKTVEESLAVWHARVGDNASKERDGAHSRGCACMECRGCQGCMSAVQLRGALGRLRPWTWTPNSGSKTEVREGDMEPKDKQWLRVTCRSYVLHYVVQ